MRVNPHLFLQTQRSLAATVLACSLTALSACNHSAASDQQLQEQAAKATEQARQQSAEALQQARVAAANAERTVNDVAAGVKQGFDSKSQAGRLDLNSASQEDLSALPGVTDGKAAQIIHHRPYASSHDLVKNRILTERQFEAVEPKVTVHPQ